MQDVKVYTKDEVRAMRRGPSLFPPIIVNMPFSGMTMLFHDSIGGSIRITDDVTAEDSSHIWNRYQLDQKTFKNNVQFDITSSSGSSYKVTMQDARWSCTCAGFGFRKRCRHLEEAKQKYSNQINQ